MKTPNNHAILLAPEDHHTLGYQKLSLSQFRTNSILTCGWKTLLRIMLLFSVFLYLLKIYLLVHYISCIWGWQDFTLMTEDWVVTNKLVFCHVLYSMVLYCAVLCCTLWCCIVLYSSLCISGTGGTDTDMFDIHINCTLWIFRLCCFLAFDVMDLSSIQIHSLV